jgi:hypothetical protein
MQSMAIIPLFAQNAFAAIITAHLSRYPGMQLDDIYKLAHQACLGSEHAVSDRNYAQRRLQQELTQSDDGPAEPVVDPISPGGSIVRVHLRPFVAGGGDVTRLLEAFVRTASEYKGSTLQLGSCLADIESLATMGSLPFLTADVQAYRSRLEQLGYPAVHHSAAYRTAYRPAYRVVASEFLPVTLRADAG